MEGTAPRSPVTIPIRNLYYLFCYAWSRFPQGDSIEVGVDQAPDLPNLFGRLLVSYANGLMRRGLHRGYVTRVEETRAPRGRMLLDEIIKSQSLRRGSVVCAIDDLTADIPHNQIIKATARKMSRAKGLDGEIAHELGLVVQRLGQVSDVRLTSRMFTQAQLSRNNRHYGSILRLCEFVHRALLPDETGGTSRFADILKDEVTMSAVFEEFLRNFYAHEQRVFRVGRELMYWDAQPRDGTSMAFMPMMETDITMRSRDRTIVMDAKYYKEVLSSRAGPGKVRSGHLYQLYAYMEHAAPRSPGVPCSGVLIYPAVGAPISLRYHLRGYEVMVRSIDLDRPWKDIHDELLAIPFEFDRASAA